MTAGWIGQMAGVGWGFPTEFRWLGEIIPADDVPEWQPEMVNAFAQDDLYVEMTFLRTLEEYGFDVSTTQAGVDFANSKYILWVANRQGRQNLRNRIAPPDSGHPQFNPAADAIDYQIEADFSGLIAPGLPNTAIALGETFGRMMNYGDGLYGGQFVGAMYAEAFFEDDPAKIVAKGLRAIPAESQYAEAVRDVIRWHAEIPDDWEETWQLIEDKYNKDPEYGQFRYGDLNNGANIDAKLNGAYIVLGLLYGKGDVDQTIIISMRAGQDSDCNPSNAAGILLTAQGYENVPEKFVSALERDTKFSFTEYTFPGLIDVTEELARQAIVRAGGRVERDSAGAEVFVIPVQETVPSALEKSHAPGDIANSTFSDEEWSQVEGNKLFKYSLLVLVLAMLLALKENRNLRAAALLIPLALILALSAWLYSAIPADGISTLNLPAVIETFGCGLALLLLVQPLLRSGGGIQSLLAAIVVLALAGYVGTWAAEEGRSTAASSVALYAFALFAAVFLATTVAAAMLSRTSYSRLRFIGSFLAVGYVASIVGMYVVVTRIAGIGGPFGEIASMQTVFIGALALTIVIFLLMLPFLILCYTNSTYDERLRAWLRVAA